MQLLLDSAVLQKWSVVGLVVGLVVCKKGPQEEVVDLGKTWGGHWHWLWLWRRRELENANDKTKRSRE
jgi:hypothetical protein